MLAQTYDPAVLEGKTSATSLRSGAGTRLVPAGRQLELGRLHAAPQSIAIIFTSKDQQNATFNGLALVAIMMACGSGAG